MLFECICCSNDCTKIKLKDVNERDVLKLNIKQVAFSGELLKGFKMCYREEGEPEVS